MTKATGTERARQNQELTIFHDVAKALTSSLDLDSILQTIMEKMAEYFRPDTWSLLMVDETRGIVLRYRRRKCSGVVEEYPFKSRRGYCGMGRQAW